MTARNLLRARDRHHAPVSFAELFFDLVFVFALTQVTGLLSEELTWVNMVRGAAILAVVWFSWAGFSWLTNIVKADDGWARLAMFAAMGAMLILSMMVSECQFHSKV